MRAVRGVLVLCAVAACRRPEPGAEGEEHVAPIHVTCAAPAARAATDRIVVRGVVAAPPDRQALVAPAVAGRIADVAVVEGQRVARGDLLAVIDEPALAAAEGEARAQLTSARAAAVAASAAAARAHRLLDEGIAARRDVEDAHGRGPAGSLSIEALGRSRWRLRRTRGTRYVC